MAHSLLAASVSSNFIDHKIRRRKTTYRHGAQVKDVPVMFWSILRYGTARKEVCGGRLL